MAVQATLADGPVIQATATTAALAWLRLSVNIETAKPAPAVPMRRRTLTIPLTAVQVIIADIAATADIASATDMGILQ
jgi:hypothetical protein